MESFVNIGIGYSIAVLSQLIIFPWFGVYLPLSDNLLIGLWFTAISLARSYTVRRFFNWMHHQQTMRRYRDSRWT